MVSAMQYAINLHVILKAFTLYIPHAIILFLNLPAHIIKRWYNKIPKPINTNINLLFSYLIHTQRTLHFIF